jgi:hypothetical protein
MCNECINTECIDVYVNPCDEGIATGILAPSTGDYTIMFEYNGITKTLSLQGTINEQFILPNVFVAPYVYLVRIYNDTNELLNDLCYKFYSHLTLGAANNITPTPPTGASKLIIVDVDGQDFTDAFFALYEIVAISTDNQTYLRDVGFTQSGNTVTAISFSFYNGQTIFAQS